jgi:hypothetical protein
MMIDYDNKHARGKAAYQILAALALFVILFLFAQHWMKKDDDVSNPDEFAKRTPRSVPGIAIDPEPFRNQLIAIEDLIYAENDPTYQDAEAIQKAVNTLTEEMRKGNRKMQTRSFRLMTFGEAIGSEADVGIGMIPVTARDRWIRDWEKLVKAEFKQVDWLEAFIARETVSEDSLIPNLQGILSNLENLVNDAEGEIDDFGDIDINLRNINQGDAATKLEDWRSWAENWLLNVDNATLDLPDSLEVPEKFRFAFMDVQFAIRRMKQLPNPGPGAFLGAGDEGLNALYLPNKHSRNAWLKDVLRIINQARTKLQQ